MGSKPVPFSPVTPLSPGDGPDGASQGCSFHEGLEPPVQEVGGVAGRTGPECKGLNGYTQWDPVPASLTLSAQ